MKTRKANEKLQSNENARIITWPVKLSVDEAQKIDKLIDVFADGVRSLYIRAALLNYKPTKNDFK